MTERLNQLNLVVADMTASLGFYRLLLSAAEDTASGAADEAAFDAADNDPHLALTLPGGFRLEMDTEDAARLWHAGLRANPASGRVVIGFAVESRAAVDERYGRLTAAGYQGRQPPFDAFWGSRYAIVADPDGNDIGLMSPVDESTRSWPPEESPGRAE
jgi:catechol 2,3-dioxygenase-like lactoylglutathione lyase family enzyme